MPTLHLTDKTVRTLPAPSTRTDYFDDVVTGLVLRVTPSGRKVWNLVYKHRGRTRRVSVGGYPALELADARKAARDALTDRAKGHDPAARRQDSKHDLTFDKLADLYVERYAKPRKRSWRQDARQLRVFCRPRWAHKRAADVTRADVRELLADVVAARSGVIANRLRACVGKCFSWALAQGLVQDNPVLGLPAPGRETRRERVLTDDELRQFWIDLTNAERRWHEAQDAKRRAPDNALSPTLGLWLRLRLFTAQRGGDVAGMEWSHVDLKRALWEIPASRFKNGRAHVVPLTAPVVTLLETRRAAQPIDRYVLEGGRGHAARNGIGAAFTLPDFVAHDLRRTAATRMAQLGVPRFVVGRVLGHADPSVTGTYDRHEYLAEKRDALERWAKHVNAVIERGA